MIIFQMVVCKKWSYLVSGARLFQIFNIHKLKSTGSVSLITYGLSVLGNLARVVTSLVEVKDDFKLILSHVLAFGLNAYIVLCFFIFREKKEKKQWLDHYFISRIVFIPSNWHQLLWKYNNLGNFFSRIFWLFE